MSTLPHAPYYGPYHAASRHLAAIDADWARLVAEVGHCRLQPKPAREPYEALVRAVAYQQLHVRAGDAMLARLLACQPQPAFPTPAQLLALDSGQLRGCGFSGRKSDTIHAIAAATLNGRVPSRQEAARLSDAALIERLVTLPGIGRWTVEMLLLYTLARPDILPVDDFGVREGYRFLKALPALPGRRELLAATAACSPYRSVATWYLWQVPSLADYQPRPGKRRAQVGSEG
ncbi:DNA-3-methyladenine glycosylase family protein [Vogesella indigofera]|uniref:DNA-3-methyladenine glycosylase family protein n=1 Tax=Vogesella indigofera TaxID=45465 RepID=UPI00234F4309|nr:DNA-3-methyladenine glycosylase [Vogesella indigofera]MDC7701818.1 DNA-3-methyladenine glycosylase [Vogesella indigofera]